MELQQIIEKIEALETRANELLNSAETDTTVAISDVKSMIETEIAPEIERLKTEREAREREEDMKGLRSQVGTLEDVINELKKPIAPFAIGSPALELDTDDDPYATGQKSFYSDIYYAGTGDAEARTRLLTPGANADWNSTGWNRAPDGKAMTEGTAAQGGYLVQKQIERQIVEARELDNVLRDLSTIVNVNTNEIELDQLSLATAAGWTAELAAKTESTSLALASVSATVFTIAGLATISNQLLADANPAIDRLVTNDLAKRITAVEEAGFLSGSGTGQPLGLLNTPAINGVTLTDTTVTATGGLLDAILDAIGKTQLDHGEPSAILMHPRTWTRILKAKDAAGTYLVGPESVQQGRSTGLSIFGYKVVLSNRIPTNLGSGTNESRVIVGDFTEGLVLDRQGITVDSSAHVGFTTNTTVFRSESRVGYTAARAPKAFCVIGGVGLVNG